MNKQNRPFLLLPSSSDIKSKCGSGLDVFNGPLFRLLKETFINEDPRDYFKIIVLTPNGFVDCDVDGHVSLYGINHNAFESRDSVRNHLDINQDRLIKQFQGILATNDCQCSKLYVALTLGHAEVFARLMNNRSLSSLMNGIDVKYIRESDIQLKLRLPLKKVLEVVKKDTKSGFGHRTYTINPTVFRSGLASITDAVAMAQSGEPCGGSLYYISPTKGVNTFNYFMKGANHNKFFLDNGLISYLKRAKNEMSKGMPLTSVPTATETLELYEAIVDDLNEVQQKNLHIVIPDNPVDQADALKSILDNKDIIIRLADKADVMVPIHHCHVLNKTQSFVDHAKSIFEALDWHKNIRLAVPTKDKIESDFGDLPARLPRELLKQVIELRAPGEKERYINKVHFLALNEVTMPYGIFEDTMIFCETNGLTDVTTDQQRVSAVLGGMNSLKPRKATKVCHLLRNEVTQENVMNSEDYLNYCYESEIDTSSMRDQCISAIYNNPRAFVTDWNTQIEKVFTLDVEGCDLDNSEKVLSEFEEVEVMMPVCASIDLIHSLKRYFWRFFMKPEHVPADQTLRYNAIIEYFSCNPDIIGGKGSCRFDYAEFNKMFSHVPHLVI